MNDRGVTREIQDEFSAYLPGDTVQRIRRLRRIRELLNQGDLTKNQIAGELDISRPALDRYLKRIEAEDAAAQEDGQGAA